MADIEVLIEALEQFGGQAELRVKLENVAPFTATAGTGAGLMDESVQLQQADRQATDAVMRYLTDVDHGMTGYRDGVNRIATTYLATEDRVLTTLNDVMPQRKDLPAVDERFLSAGKEGN